MQCASIAAATLALCLATAGASAGDGMAAAGDAGPASPACGRALALLQVQEAQVLDARQRETAAAGHAASAAALAFAIPGLKAARRQAAEACLGATGDAPPSVQRLAQPPVTVAPVAVPRAGAALTLQAPLPAALPPPVQQNPPGAVLTSCDAGGCWASDGSRLNRVGTQLVGPRGPCRVHGALLSCP